MELMGPHKEDFTVIAQGVFVDDAALALPCRVRYPDTANAQVAAPGFAIKFLPQRLIKFLLTIFSEQLHHQMRI